MDGSRQLLINCRPDQRRVAVLEGGVTAELFFERLPDRTLVGDIYKGRVVRVLPGMQCAFLELGLNRTAFLYVADVARDDEAEEGGADEAPDEERGRGEEHPPIGRLLEPGQELLVQVARDPIGSKGARITTRIGLPGRYVVYQPNDPSLGVSRRIADPDERRRLRELAEKLRPDRGGMIVRTVAEGVGEEELRRDLAVLRALWADVEQRGIRAEAPALIHEDLDVTLRSVRDLLTSDVDRVLVDDEDEARRIREFVRRVMPGFEACVELWPDPDPMFERFGLEWEITRATRRRVWLRSGGSIAIDETEALTAIDVNTGGYTGKGNFEETVRAINVEAAREIAYQLRFRDIGGLIVIDFIDMGASESRRRVEEALRQALADDKARSYILPMSELGLVEMTRKRVRESIVQSLTEPCFYCEGRGYLRAVRVTVDGIVSRLRRLVASGARGRLRVQAHPSVTEALVEDYQELLLGFQREHDVEIEVEPREEMHYERVEID